MIEQNNSSLEIQEGGYAAIGTNVLSFWVNELELL
jgi:hypothetical protein